MPALFVFLLKVNIALFLFSAGYYMVLRHLTFYTLNRVYLISAILIATIYPTINLAGFANRHQQLTQPVQTVIYSWSAKATSLAQPLAQPVYWHWLLVLFWVGVTVLSVKLLLQLCSLFKLYRQSTPAMIRNYRVRLIKGDNAPFSFWRSIYINPKNHALTDLDAILLHEQIHVDQWHTLDVLLAEISSIFYWFNPGIWLMKKAVRENIEFITDQKILQKGMDSKQYQYSLVNVSFAAAPQTVVSHFNISTIKKRIMMMNAKRSSKFNLTRYAVLVPAVLICLFCVSLSKAELIKKSKNAYSKIVLQVEKINATSIDNAPEVQPKLIKRVATVKTPINKRSQLTTEQDEKKDNLSGDTTGTEKKLFGVVTNIKIKTDVADTIKKNTPIIIYMVDGNITTKNVLYNIPHEDIKSMEISKSKNGDQAVLNLTTKSADASKVVKRIRIDGENLKDVSFTVDSAKNGNRKLLNIGTSSLADKLIILDGKVITEKELKKISPSDIDHMTFKSAREMTTLYGDQAKNGVMFIVSKKK